MVKNVVGDDVQLRRGDHVSYRRVVNDAGKRMAIEVTKLAQKESPEEHMSAAESNEARKRYLRERSEKLRKARLEAGSAGSEGKSAGSGAAGATPDRRQRTKNRRDQFGQEKSENTTSGILLDIVGIDRSAATKKIVVAKGPDATRGFNTTYQESRGRTERKLSVGAIEFVPSAYE